MSSITTFDTIEYNDSSHIEEKNGLLQELQSLYQRREEEKLTIVSTVQRKSKKRKSNPIGKPHHLQEQKQQFDEADCSALSHLKSSQGTALSPILNRNPTISSFTVVPSVKRRSGLVRRTHSPITVPSPVAKSVAQFYFSKKNLPYLTMGSKAVPISEGLTPLLLPRIADNDHKVQKKRKRCHSPKNGSRSRSQSPNGRRSPNPLNGAPGAVQVKIVSPTLRGVVESAKILRYGIISFPTETMYSLVSFLPFKRRTTETLVDSSDRLWVSLLNIKKRGECHNSQTSLSDPPLLYVHRPDYANHFVSFTKPKTYLFKQQLDEMKESSEGTNTKYTAVTFSESYEVQRRLASAFWPGPVTIFAPVKQLGSKTAKTSFSVQEPSQDQHARIKKEALPSCSSLISLTSESSDDQPPTFSTNECDFEENLPILPQTALFRRDDILDSSGVRDETYFVGMRCPSHPLAHRILSEVYNDQDRNINVVSSPKPRRRIGAVLGFNASINGPSPFSCIDVCSNLLSIQDQQSLTSNNSKPTVHVMNGEDKRELFTVPACQCVQSSFVSLLIDAPSRTVFLLRNKAHLTSEQANEDFAIQLEDVKRALYHKTVDHPGSVKARAITAIMNKWTVTEKVV